MSQYIQYINMDTCNLFLEVEYKVSLSLIKEGCRICNISYVGGGVIFFEKKQMKNAIFFEKEQLENNELELLKKYIQKQLPNQNSDYVVVYSKINKYHPNFYYYNIIVIVSSDIQHLKKIMKIHKLKAFL